MESQQAEKCEDKKTVNNDSDDEDDKEDAIVTMMDVLEQENEQEENVNAVLGGSDDKNCTYSQGYNARQPLYACKTCCKDGSAAVCLACSYNCHEGHELVELYTKRNFRCDCGNSKFVDVKCTLEAAKDAINEKNQYNQNFKGLYCTCHRPYPDPDDEIEDFMSQCIICEDWYHSRHLEGEKSKLEGEGEVICHICMGKLPFLFNYVGKDLPAESGQSGVCKIATSVSQGIQLQAVLLPNGWRKLLCQCQSCTNLYENHQVSFLLDEADSIAFYEDKNKERASQVQQEREMRALSSLDHVQKLEVIKGFNDMKSALLEHLQTFKDSKRVVSGDDIREFFDELQAKRRRVMTPPSTCR